MPRLCYAAECGRGRRLTPASKLVIIGDGACGKTSLLSVFTLGYFPKVRPLPASIGQAWMSEYR